MKNSISITIELIEIMFVCGSVLLVNSHYIAGTIIVCLSVLGGMARFGAKMNLESERLKGQDENVNKIKDAIYKASNMIAQSPVDNDVIKH